jgi:uncharacterized membrane protein YheB (UPF0754 family)
MIKQYIIKNLLSYQVKQIKDILNIKEVVLRQNKDKEHFCDLIVGINQSELDVIVRLGFVVSPFAFSVENSGYKRYYN